MACTYCYIHKNKQRMKDYNARIRETILNGSFSQSIINNFSEYKEQISHIALWGAEPTINAEYFKTFITPLFDYFPNLNEVMFSTNALLGINAIDHFIVTMNNYAEEHNRKMRLELQFSLDGPDYINDSSRHPGATKSTLQAIKDVVEKYKNLNGNFGMILTTKATLTTDWMEYLAENPNKMQEYFEFFSNIQNNMLDIIKDNKNIQLYLAGYPTCVDPGEHTIEDGEKFAKYIKALRKVDVSKCPPYKHPLYLQCIKEYHINEYNPQYRIGSCACSAGLGSWSVDCEGNIMACHRTYDNLYMGTSLSELFCDDTSTRVDQKTNWNLAINRLDYQSIVFHRSQESRKAFLNYILQGLVIAGQVDKKYLEPYWFERLFRSIGAITCFIGQGEMTGSIYLTTTSYIHLLAHGALEELWDYYDETIFDPEDLYEQ